MLKFIPKLNSLPLELLDNIASLLDTKSFINFTSLCKKTKKVDRQLIWKNKCFREYTFTSHWIKNWRDQYRKLYLRLCVECHKKTKLYNEFYKCKVCRKCEVEHEKYHMVTARKAALQYLMKKEDLNKLPHIERLNPYNSFQNMKLYLKVDIINYIKSQQSGDIKRRMDKRIVTSISKTFKFTLYNNLLINEYNVYPDALAYILMNINAYTQLYQKYLRYNNRPVIPVIHKGLELAFICTYTTLDWTVFPSFPYLLKYMILLTNHCLPLSINPYIDYCINQVINKNKEQYLRKLEIERVYYELKNKGVSVNIYKIPYIIDYIYYGARINIQARERRSIENKYSIEDFILDGKDVQTQLKKLVILYDFLAKHTNIATIRLQSLIRNTIQNSFRTYRIVLYNWYKENPNLRYLLPLTLYEFL